MAVKSKPQIEAYIGAGGSGKGVSIERRLKELKPTRIVIWDPRDEYPKHGREVSLEELRATAEKSGTTGRLALRVVPKGSTDLKKAFAFVCKVVFETGYMVFLAEELSDVTMPSWAPDAWKQITTQSRHKHLIVLGAAQRPALVDKNFFGNCTYLRVFTLRYLPDRRTMAEALDVPLEQVTALQTIDGPSGVTINYIERDFRAGLLQSGQIKLRK